MKPYKTSAHIYSLDGDIDEITVIEERQLSPIQNGYLVDYKGQKCTAIFNYFTCSFYADDIYGLVEE